MRLLRFRLAVLAAACAAGLVVSAVTAAPASAPGQPAQNAYTIYTPDGRRTLPVRPSGNTELVSIDQLTGPFGLTVTEDNVLRGLVITSRGARILAIPGQSFVQAGGEVVQLSAPVQRDRNSWLVPIDFISALGRAVGQRVVLRRDSRLILVGDVRVPRVGGTFTRSGPSGQLVLDVQPPTPNRVTRDGNRLTIRFDAVALDPEPITGILPEFIAGTRVEGPALIVELGAQAASHRVADDPARLTIDLLPPGPPPGTPPPPAAPLPAIDPSPGAIRTVVIDPGHGGDDEGVKGAAGAKEKDVTLQVARRLKTAIESRMGLRVLLTRDADDNVPIDRRTALANNNKADLFISLHANAALRPEVRGAQVLSLSLTDYQAELSAEPVRGLPVPVVGGGTRVLRAVEWDLAQLPFADRSAALGGILVRQLTERGVPLYARPAAQLPLRVLVGANMPAVLLEMGFLSNAQDERALTGDLQAPIVDALVLMISNVRRGVPSGGGGGEARQ